MGGNSKRCYLWSIIKRKSYHVDSELGGFREDDIILQILGCISWSLAGNWKLYFCNKGMEAINNCIFLWVGFVFVSLGCF